MTELKFIYDDGENRVVLTTKAEYLPEVMQQFRMFLLGAGFGSKGVNEYIKPD